MLRGLLILSTISDGISHRQNGTPAFPTNIGDILVHCHACETDENNC